MLWPNAHLTSVMELFILAIPTAFSPLLFFFQKLERINGYEVLCLFVFLFERNEKYFYSSAADIYKYQSNTAMLATLRHHNSILKRPSMGHSIKGHSARSPPSISSSLGPLSPSTTMNTCCNHSQCSKAISDRAATVEDKWNKEIMNVFSSQIQDGTLFTPPVSLLMPWALDTLFICYQSFSPAQLVSLPLPSILKVSFLNIFFLQ